MHRVKVMGVAFVAIVVLGAASAGGAMAAKGLVLKADGMVLPVGSDGAKIVENGDLTLTTSMGTTECRTESLSTIRSDELEIYARITGIGLEEYPEPPTTSICEGALPTASVNLLEVFVIGVNGKSTGIASNVNTPWPGYSGCGYKPGHLGKTKTKTKYGPVVADFTNAKWVENGVGGCPAGAQKIEVSGTVTLTTEIGGISYPVESEEVKT